jgi:hypothetical protein
MFLPTGRHSPVVMFSGTNLADSPKNRGLSHPAAPHLPLKPHFQKQTPSITPAPQKSTNSLWAKLPWMLALFTTAFTPSTQKPAYSQAPSTVQTSQTNNNTTQGTTPPGDLLIDLPFRQHQQIIPFRTDTQPLSAQDELRYQTLKKAWKDTEALDIFDANRPVYTRSLQSNWNQLLNDAQMERGAAKTILYKLFEDQLQDEIENPSPQLIRFDYVNHDERIGQYKQGKLSLEKLKTEIRWRGLEGLANHLGSLNSQSLNDHTKRFYPLVKKMIDTEKNDQIQKWAQSTLQYMFPGMSGTQQQETINRFQAMFLETPDSPTKLFAMKGLATMRMQSSFQAAWAGVIKQVENALSQTVNDAKTDPKKANDLPYYVTFLGMVQSPDVASHITPLLTPTTSPQMQTAMAWSLGRSPQIQNVALLESILNNGKYNPVAREMALNSLNAIRSVEPQRIDGLIKDYSVDRPMIDDTVEEAARSMLAMQQDESRTVADYYINTLLPNEVERREYKQLRSQYVKGLEKLNLAQLNFIDRALIPYREFLPTIIAKQGKHEIIKGSVTESPSYKYLIGHRIQDGRMWDDVSGVSSTGGAVTSAQVLYPGRFNTFAHEFMHHLHQMVLNPQGKGRTIENLFKQGKALDYYAAGDEYEYFGQGGEAYNARFKDHAILYAIIFNNGFESTDSHTRSQLNRQDNDLYSFIKDLQNKADLLKKTGS